MVGGFSAFQRAQQEESLIQAWSVNQASLTSFSRQELALRARALPSTEGAVPWIRIGDDSAPPIPQTRTNVVTYQTKAGDSTYELARRFGISVQTIVWANDLQDADHLPIGAEIIIPPTTGVLHTVKPGETLTGVAARYSVEPQAIMAYTPNGITDPNLLPMGRRIMIPGGIMPAPVRPVFVPPAVSGNEAVVTQPSTSSGSSATTAAPVAIPAPVTQPVAPVAAAATNAAVRPPGGGATGSFAWPTFGPIFQYFGENGHEGIDISPPYGTPVYAADGGTVVAMEQLAWSYGWYILIDHGNGFLTRYAHLSSFAVGYGQRVAKGQLIGTVGSTGKSTGPHLHFEIIQGRTPVNPLRYLP